MQMGREFGLFSLLSLPSSRGSCKQLIHTTFAINVIVTCLSFGKIRSFSYTWKLTYLNFMSQRVMEWFRLDWKGPRDHPCACLGIRGAFPLDISAIVLHDIWESCVVLSPC